MRCPQCGDLIGVYEPVVVLADGAPPRLSALFLSPELTGDRVVLVHRGCHAGSVVGPEPEAEPS